MSYEEWLATDEGRAHRNARRRQLYRERSVGVVRPLGKSLEEKRQRPCRRGHSRHDAKVKMDKNGKPQLICRECCNARRRKR